MCLSKFNMFVATRLSKNSLKKKEHSLMLCQINGICDNCLKLKSEFSSLVLPSLQYIAKVNVLQWLC